MIAARQDVYYAIDTERTYQESLVRNDVKLQRPMEQLAIIEELCSRMKSHWYDVAGDPPMDFMRKIAATAVRSMEQHGAPKRVV